ncbi:MAG: hypothetical protein ACOH14_14275 [Rhodoglobus sp.]
MGTLIYGTKMEAEVEDQSLFHLDVLLARLRGTPFQLHVGLGGNRDGNLLSLAVTAGVPITLEYLNSPELSLDLDIINRATSAVLEGGFVSIPFRFGSDRR